VHGDASSHGGQQWVGRGLRTPAIVCGGGRPASRRAQGGGISAAALESGLDTLDILQAATDDSDADVRAYARRALADRRASTAGPIA
jgi:hypothetical protein